MLCLCKISILFFFLKFYLVLVLISFIINHLNMFNYNIYNGIIIQKGLISLSL